MENNVIFICPSWEERSYLGFLKDCDDTAPNKVVVIKKVRPINEQEIVNSINSIIDACSNRHIDYEIIEWKEASPDNWGKLQTRLNGLLTTDNRIHLDITTMPRDILWTLLFFFSQYSNHVDVRYYQPCSYNETWLSREPANPRFLLKHSGIVELGKPTCLVVITGFDTERTKQIVTKFEPQRIILCIQEGEQFGNSNRNKDTIHEESCNLLGNTNVTITKINAYSDDFGFETINSLLDSLSNYNVILASFGPKPSAIGAYKAYQHHPNIALCYVPCKEFNKDYCKGLGGLLKMSFK